MKLKILGSSSSGNCYVFTSTSGQILILECGIKWKQILQGIDFRSNDIAGCIVTHCHMDHAKGTRSLLSNGIPVYASNGTFEALGINSHHNAYVIKSRQQFSVGEYTVKAFDVNHDVPEPLGFIIEHSEMGSVLFLTDTYYSQYKFPSVDHVMIEANYDPVLLESNSPFLINRTMTSHMSIDTTITTLKSMNLSRVQNIILVHLSERNSIEHDFIKKVTGSTGKNVQVASTGKEIDLSINIFDF